MKISKHVHSCLLIEDQGKVVLADPGNYTYDEKALDLNSINQLDYLLLTHEHPDHFYLPFVKEITAKFPSVKILTNSSIVDQLEKENINATDQGDELVKLEEAAHEHVFGIPQMPPNVLFQIFGKLTHPGDSEQYELKTDVLALPVQAPWTSLTKAAERAVGLKPKVVIPIHDWHWSEAARNNFYERLTSYFGQNGISFKAVKTGEVIEV